MATAISKPNGSALVPADQWQDKIALIKSTVAKGCTDLELDLFLYTAKKRGLDPLTKQIYAVKRKTKDGDVMTIQTGIDGFRCVAGRTGELAGIDDAVFDVEGAPHPNRATVTVFRAVNGVRCPFTATARWDEYKQVKYDGSLMGLWARMPYTMLAKCAEALALRKAFPEDLSGMYTADEMAGEANGLVDAAAVTVGKGKTDATIDATDIPVWMDDLAEQLEYIENACDEDELRKLYTGAYKKAQSLRDENAMKAIIAAKDKKRKEFAA